MTRRIIFFCLVTLGLLSTLLTACAPTPGAGAEGKTDLKMAAMSGMPEGVKKSSLTTQQAYQFAVANPEMMKEIPCYCGCGAMGHTSNYSCYVKSDTGGKITFDDHAQGCSICVDITQDTMRMLREGKTVKEIRAAIDQTYAKYGPSNIEQ
jgi:hypothetical protein